MIKSLKLILVITLVIILQVLLLPSERCYAIQQIYEKSCFAEDEDTQKEDNKDKVKNDDTKTNENDNKVEESEKDIPRVKNVTQVSENTVEISFNVPIELSKGVKPNNYWIQSLSDSKPSDIATLGKDEQINNKNSLTNDKVNIASKNEANKTFVMTFKNKIPSKKQYKIIIYYLTVPGDDDYAGTNGTVIFTGK